MRREHWRPNVEMINGDYRIEVTLDGCGGDVRRAELNGIGGCRPSGSRTIRPKILLSFAKTPSAF